jgi:hypothetical protein
VSPHIATAAVQGTSVPVSASMMRHSRRMPSSRLAGADGGGIRIAQCRPPRRIS